jgi:hypothetical protein
MGHFSRASAPTIGLHFIRHCLHYFQRPRIFFWRQSAFLTDVRHTFGQPSIDALRYLTISKQKISPGTSLGEGGGEQEEHGEGAHGWILRQKPA